MLKITYIKHVQKCRPESTAWGPSVDGSPMTIKPRLARVNATFMRRLAL